jgi:hypothetical protein
MRWTYSEKLHIGWYIDATDNFIGYRVAKYPHHWVGSSPNAEIEVATKEEAMAWVESVYVLEQT